MIIDKEKTESLVDDFIKIGFDQKEALVYVSLLTLGEVGASKISKDTGLHGQFVYDSLEKLENRNMVQHVLVNGRKKFSARNPEVLSVMADQKKKISDELSKKLLNIVNFVDEQSFEIIKGRDDFVAQEFKSMQECEEGSEILVIGGLGDRYVENMGNLFNEYEFQRIKKNISLRYIGCEAQREIIQKIYEPRKLMHSRLLPGSFIGDVDTTIFPDKISLSFFGAPVISFTIKSAQMVESQRQFFETLWKLGK